MFGGINGISSFNPSDIEDNPYTPQPIITSLEIFNKEIRPSDESGILEKSIMETSEIVLKHDPSSVSPTIWRDKTTVLHINCKDMTENGTT